jgi:Fur family transcriptional regulator, peroxide stress response regulator
MTKESIIAKMKEKGLKITPQRLAIIQVLIERGNLHPGTRLIYEEAKKMRKSLSLSTTYATLNEFSRYGIIKTLEFDRMENRYESNITEHINLICKGCKKIMDFKLPFKIDTNEVERKSGFRVTDRRFEYNGYCEECKKK